MKLLSYPRSGTNLLQHMIRSCNGNVLPTHYIKDGSKSDEKLILIIRNYKECITRNLYSWQDKYKKNRCINNDLIDRLFTSEYDITARANTYIHNIRVFDNWNNDKYLIYYEDLIKDKEAFIRLAEWLNISTHIFNWDIEFKNSLKNYKDPSVSNLTAHYHERFLEDPVYFDVQIIQSAGNYLYNKYLQHYETTIHNP